MVKDLTEEELEAIEKAGARFVRRTQVLSLVAEVRRRRAEKPAGTKHELTLEEAVGTEEK
jgi:hypothetical protein